MTGAEHYTEAEKRIRASDYQRQTAADNDDLTYAMHEAAQAQVHATLALAAATVADADWFDVTSGSNREVNRIAQQVLEAYDQYLDSDILDPLAAEIGHLREALTMAVQS